VGVPVVLDLVVRPALQLRRNRRPPITQQSSCIHVTSETNN
jgi:hypothetical protein